MNNNLSNGREALWRWEVESGGKMQSAATSKAELKALKTKYWRPNCPHRAFLRDWLGWQWCLIDWWRTLKDKDSSWWFYFKTTRIFIK